MHSKTRIIFASFAILLAGCATNRHANNQWTTEITELHMLNSHDGWAWFGWFNDPRLLLHTHDGGVTWRDVTPREFSYVQEGAYFGDARNAWVPIFNKTNATAGLLHTADAGKTWILVTLTNAPVFDEVPSFKLYSSKYGIGQTIDGGLGSYYVTFFETRDTGKNWNVMPFTPPVHVSDVFTNMLRLSSVGSPVFSRYGDRIAFFPPASAIITHCNTDDENPKGVTQVSVTTNLGKTWRSLDLPLPTRYHDYLCIPLEPVFVDRKHAVLASRVFKRTSDFYNGGDLFFYSSNDGGASWIRQPTVVNLGDCGLSDFKVLSSQCYLVETYTNILVTHDAAHTWKSVTRSISFGEHPDPDRGIFSMDFVDAAHGWLILYPRDSTYHYGKFHLYRTSNGGKTWAELPARIVQKEN